MTGEDGIAVEMGIRTSPYANVSPATVIRGQSKYVVTFVPASSVLPSALQVSVNGSPPTSSFVTHVLLRVSQNRTVPSEEQLANSNSRTGLKSTFSTACP
jgi:hypothetical protein